MVGISPLVAYRWKGLVTSCVSVLADSYSSSLLSWNRCGSADGMVDSIWIIFANSPASNKSYSQH